MRLVLGLAFVVTLAMPAAPAAAQQPNAYGGKSFFDAVHPDDLKNFCIFRGDAYSIGAFMCEGKQANVCAGPSDAPPSGTTNMGHAFWRATNAGQVCGGGD